MSKYVLPTQAPTDLPTWTVQVEGTAIPASYQVLSVTVTKVVDRISRARIELLDGDAAAESFPISNTELFIPGKEIRILGGYNNEESQVFVGIIVIHRIRSRPGTGSRLIIECQHKAVKLTGNIRSAYYYEITDSKLFESLCDRHGVEHDITKTNVTYNEIVQQRNTDWDLLLARVRANAMFIFTNDDKVRISPIDTSADPVLSVVYGGTILEFDAEIDARTQPQSVTAASWNLSSQELQTHEAQEPEIPNLGNLSSDTLSGLELRQETSLIHNGNRPLEELSAWADASIFRSRLAKVRARLRFRGVAAANPGDLIDVSGLGDRFSGLSVITGVRQEFGQGTWTTDVQIGTPNMTVFNSSLDGSTISQSLIPTNHGLYIGVVTQIQDDPDNESRIRVRAPLISEDEQGVWTRIVTMHAGDERGTVFRPDIGDEVIIGYIDGDPRDPVLLGSLHSSAKPAPIPAADDNNIKGIVTRSGNKIIFDDEAVSILITTNNGNSLTLSDEDGGITIADENDNKIVMNSDGITLDSAADIKINAQGNVEFSGNNITISAQAMLKADGGAGAELTSTASAVIKGATVLIN